MMNVDFDDLLLWFGMVFFGCSAVYFGLNRIAPLARKHFEDHDDDASA